MEREPVACSLSQTDAAEQLGEWADVRRRALSTAPVDGGVSMTFPLEIAARVEDLAAREADCCRFLTITVARTPSTVIVTISSPDPAAAPAIALLAGP